MRHLALVSFQLSLFPSRPIAADGTMGSENSARRTPHQLLKSAISYCDWRAEHFRLSAADRWNPDRRAYIQARQILERVMHMDVRPELALPALQPAHSLTPLEIEFSRSSRACLADELLAADPRLSDRRLLQSLPRKKLASMLARAIEAAPAERKRA